MTSPVPPNDSESETASPEETEQNRSSDPVSEPEHASVGEEATDRDAAVRRGSPFAAKPDQASGVMVLPVEILDPEWGVLRAANWASAWVAIFAIACVSMFPGGGVIVAALGCGLASVGLFSSRQVIAAILLLLHASLFFACYQKLL
ncbi:hypothetical protein [Rhodopirellula sallentina]|uniref:Putative membrane protein n=1 Tax=Rhodopirellula sallentina SM41 TaxID=1263870 RepID=M5UGP2_9BACT|nr:hypothetical protein [Rhodopirellula sallentina]EMI55183.1 putative membrane protein [Rhodopirellula sallentina SM41]